MRFRTEIEIRKSKHTIGINDRLVALGSCFSQAIGSRLSEGGLNISVTPLGVLFNPVSIANIINRALAAEEFTDTDLFRDNDGVFHALDFESRRQGVSSEELLTTLNRDFSIFRENLLASDYWLITFGTAWCFRHLPTSKIVGNCHKLPDCQFERNLCEIDEIVHLWDGILRVASRVIFTVSPVRHLNDGLHGNTLSKGRLHLAIEKLTRKYENAEYFPAFEALNDDLRDYRFYADDLKHPSSMAEEYIFDLFKKCYFDEKNIRAIDNNRRATLITRHRPIIQ